MVKYETMITNSNKNIQKYNNYKEQMRRLNKAINNSFFLEALFIEYAIMEDRTESILRYEGNGVKPRYEGGTVGIDSKLRKIKKLAEDKKALPRKYFDDSFIDEILEWKEERNKLIHALMKQSLTTDKLARLSAEGYDLLRDLSRRASNYKRAVERKEAQN